MEQREQWIWLPAAAYGNRQTTFYHTDSVRRPDTGKFTVVRFERAYRFDKPIASARLRFSGDTAFILRCNGQPLGHGPVLVGGDFLTNDRPRPQHYATEITLSADSIGSDFAGCAEGILEFDALVRMQPVRLNEYSRGHGGFFLDGHVTFSDGTRTLIGTDETWSAQLLPSYPSPGQFDGRIAADPPVPAERIGNLWHTQTSPIPLCSLDPIRPENSTLLIQPGETKEVILPLDKIYGGYLLAEARTDGVLKAEIRFSETGERGSAEQLVFTRDTDYEGFDIHSAGELHVKAVNEGERPAALKLGFLFSHFPVESEAKTVTSDPDLNRVFDVCEHTLKICRQTIHLDSTRHLEPLACTGDYYIEMLMSACTFGDQRLSAFDIRRTAQLHRYNDGRMFHTTYSLIWVQMLWDCYMLTGESELLSDCEDALILLLERFETYMGENGLIENPPDYMFIDWLIPDGISTHHPPKALGQTCLNLFYLGALKTAARIFQSLHIPAMAARQNAKADKLRAAILTHLYDGERGLFFEGLNTPTPEHLIGKWMPKNVDKRYYRMHANILAAYFGIFDKEESADLLVRILSDNSLGEVQPYFMHFLLEAVLRNGLRDRFTLKLLEQWKAPCAECDKGLTEGFHKPEPNYGFDHSHAWAGTPAYSLPMALSGLEILEPGFRRIGLSPSLLGLESAHVEIPTPYGPIVIDMAIGEKTKLRIPDAIVRIR